MEILETVDVDGLTVAVISDEHADSPRGWDNGTKLVLSHRRYALPNEIGLNFDAYESWAEVEAAIREDYEVVGLLKVHGYDHGALALSTSTGGSFSDPWDSGVLGFIFMDRDGQTEVGTPDDRVAAVLAGDVEVFSAWMNGESYGWSVSDDRGIHLDSCWGFIDAREDCKAEGIAVAKAIAEERREAARTEDAIAALPVVLAE